MKVYRLILGIAVPLSMVASLALANPAIMQKNKPGYPYPGTAAQDVFGGSALNQSIREGNVLEGTLPGQARTPTGTTSGKSLLPPKGDPARLSPSPHLEKEGFPLYGPDKPDSTAN
jgi:hypothetical protein